MDKHRFLGAFESAKTTVAFAPMHPAVTAPAREGLVGEGRAPTLRR